MLMSGVCAVVVVVVVVFCVVVGGLYFLVSASIIAGALVIVVGFGVVDLLLSRIVVVDSDFRTAITGRDVVCAFGVGIVVSSDFLALAPLALSVIVVGILVVFCRLSSTS